MSASALLEGLLLMLMVQSGLAVPCPHSVCEAALQRCASLPPGYGITQFLTHSLCAGSLAHTMIANFALGVSALLGFLILLASSGVKSQPLQVYVYDLNQKPYSWNSLKVRFVSPVFPCRGGYSRWLRVHTKNKYELVKSSIFRFGFLGRWAH